MFSVKQALPPADAADRDRKVVLCGGSYNSHFHGLDTSGSVETNQYFHRGLTVAAPTVWPAFIFRAWKIQCSSGRKAVSIQFNAICVLKTIGGAMGMSPYKSGLRMIWQCHIN